MICHAAALCLTALLSQGEEWSAVRAMDAGSARGQAVAELLANDNIELAGSDLNLAWEAGQRAVVALEFELAFGIQEQLYRRAPAEWSGVNLALTAHKMGEWSLADQVMEELLLERPEDPAKLWSQRGIFALGSDKLHLAREYFGWAICLGSPDATGILAREDLAIHNQSAARTGFRAALVANPDHPWALRGWGLSLLEARALRPGIRNGTNL
jgi:tetratricopeptide (TPR) repeat protein